MTAAILSEPTRPPCGCQRGEEWKRPEVSKPMSFFHGNKLMHTYVAMLLWTHRVCSSKDVTYPAKHAFMCFTSAATLISSCMYNTDEYLIQLSKKTLPGKMLTP